MSDVAPASAATMKSCLSGIRVVDFSWVVAGPMATKRLGAMGAEIIKIESAARPEFSYRDGWYAVINNNKRSCTLNITSPEGQELMEFACDENNIDRNGGHLGFGPHDPSVYKEQLKK